MRDGVVFSQYSQAKCFTNNLSDCAAQLVEQRNCNQQAQGMNLSLYNHLTKCESTLALFSGY